jgi:hypothetical protein
VDWDGDGKKDLLAGDSSGCVTFFRNTGTAEAPVLAAGVRLKTGGEEIKGVPARYEKGADGKYQMQPTPDKIMGVYSKIHVADWDGDGLLDLLVGQDGPNAGQDLLLYRNTGTAREPALDKPVALKLPGPGMTRPSPYVVDWDGDGVPDLLCGTENADVRFFRNTGTRTAPAFAEGVRLDLKGDGFEKGYRCRIAVTDWNNDGKLDILIGNFYSINAPGAGRAGGNVWLFLGR